MSKKNLLHFSICACHPCAGAMLIFSVSFQFYRMIPVGNPAEEVFFATSIASQISSSRKLRVKDWLQHQSYMFSDKYQHQYKHWAHACDSGIWKEEQVVPARVMRVDGSPKPSR